MRASGPGGQNVNKVSTAVQLRFDVRRSPSLPDAVRVRLERLAGRRLTGDGVIVITANRFRSQARNREDARERLIELIRRGRHAAEAAARDAKAARLQGAARGGQAPPREVKSLRRGRSRRRLAALSVTARRRASRLASNRNHVRRSVASMKFSSRLAVATSSCLSAISCALRMAAAIALLSAISSRSISSGATNVCVVVLEALLPGDVADRAQRRAADLARALGQLVGAGEDLRGLLVEQQVVVAEVRPADVPVEILGLEIEREGVGQQPVERLGDVADGRVGQVGGGIERGVPASAGIRAC